ncbi:Basic leucine zipper 34 [Citrus sinensis]|uniref:Basic leucine zipper 34 n=1 Tax=Citrus sinensis TaxID=2711 RepID=A0ACB8JW57_CITSI|nr:Basic leucine zipper 34 [Citrus sinensis]
MLNRTRSFSSSSCISMENLASLRRSASDSLALMSSTNVIKIGVGDNFSFEGDVETRKGDDDNNNNHLNYSSDKKPSSANNEVRALTPIDSSSKIDPQKSVASNDHGKGPKRMKRLLANRVSAQRSRLRNLAYMEKLKKEIDNEEARLSVLLPLVSYYETECKLLGKMNREMKEMMEALENETAAKEAEFQALMEEKEALGLAYRLLGEGK